jgi:transposase
MTPTEIRTTVRSLRAQGRSLREIRRPLALTRNTVRRILHEPVGNVAATPP